VTQRVQMKEVLPWLVRWALRAGTRDFCPALTALDGPEQNIFFLTVHYTVFQFNVPIAQQAGQAVVPGRLSLMCVSDYISFPFYYFFFIQKNVAAWTNKRYL
jgi:hypothetical protein